MIVAEQDYIAVTDLALKAFERALEPKRLQLISGGHFDPYRSQLEVSSNAAADWFELHL
jgi:hypothetical protein